MENMVQKLDLTADQKEKMMTMKKQAKAEMKAKHDEMHAIHKEMGPLVETDKMDEAKLDALIQQEKEVVASMTKNKMMLKHQFYGVLDAKQKAMFSTMSKQCEEMPKAE